MNERAKGGPKREPPPNHGDATENGPLEAVCALEGCVQCIHVQRLLACREEVGSLLIPAALRQRVLRRGALTLLPQLLPDDETVPSAIARDTGQAEPEPEPRVCVRRAPRRQREAHPEAQAEAEAGRYEYTAST
eukprot:COSAG01_NODE_8519_length_2755_cov_8.227410_2_plen_134_part_00